MSISESHVVVVFVTKPVRSKSSRHTSYNATVVCEGKTYHENIRHGNLWSILSDDANFPTLVEVNYLSCLDISYQYLAYKSPIWLLFSVSMIYSASQLARQSSDAVYKITGGHQPISVRFIRTTPKLARARAMWPIKVNVCVVYN